MDRIDGQPRIFHQCGDDGAFAGLDGDGHGLMIKTLSELFEPGMEFLGGMFQDEVFHASAGSPGTQGDGVFLIPPIEADKGGVLSDRESGFGWRRRDF